MNVENDRSKKYQSKYFQSTFGRGLEYVKRLIGGWLLSKGQDATSRLDKILYDTKGIGAIFENTWLFRLP